MSALVCIDFSLGLHAWIQRYRISLVFLPRENNFGGGGFALDMHIFTLFDYYEDA